MTKTWGHATLIEVSPVPGQGREEVDVLLREGYAYSM